jgi:hypothetical protein
MNLAQTFQTWVMRRGPGLRRYDGLDWGSPTLEGPIRGVGDCVYPHAEVPALFWVDTALPPRHGALMLWYMPEQLAGEQTLGKWFLIVDGQQWIACKYFAARRCPGWHVAAGRVVAELRGPIGMKNPVNPELSAQLAEEMRELRANPPRRPDLVVFPRDLIDHCEIAAAIRAHTFQ